MPKISKLRMRNKKNSKKSLELVADITPYQERDIEDTVLPVLVRTTDQKKKYNYTPWMLARSICSNDERLPDICPHIFVGASMTGKLLREPPTVSSMHKIFKTGLFRRQGRISEDAARIEFDLEECPNARTLEYPFFAVKGDFLSKDRKTLYEIKSSTSRKDANRLHKNRNVLLQIWVTMDVLNLDQAVLLCYYGPDVNNNTMLISEVHITKKEKILKGWTLDLMFKNYMKFFESYCQTFMAVYPELSMTRAYQTIKKCMANNIGGGIINRGFPVGLCCRSFFDKHNMLAKTGEFKEKLEEIKKKKPKKGQDPDKEAYSEPLQKLEIKINRRSLKFSMEKNERTFSFNSKHLKDLSMIGNVEKKVYCMDFDSASAGVVVFNRGRLHQTS